MPKTYQFPKDFLWGIATSSYQTEGNNTNSDWWEWEMHKKPGQYYPKDHSGIACDSYYRYEEDLDLCVKLGVKAYRMSVEWSRLEPEEGKFNEAEFDHYKKILNAAKSRGLRVFLTLQHFTLPIWFAQKGGWSNIKAPSYFKCYVQKCAKEFLGLVDAYLTINEPQVYTLMAYTNGTWPPNKANLFYSLFVQINLMRAHRAAYTGIRSQDKKMPISFAKNIVWYDYYKDPFTIFNFLIAKFFYFLNCDFFLWPLLDKMDFIALNYYFVKHVVKCKRCDMGHIRSDLDWGIHPEGLEKILVNLKRFKKPIYITENGLADANDTKRHFFIKNMLMSCLRALEKGADVKSYFHWSLIDNFEWHQGFWPKFGLVEIDRASNLKRIPRKSFYYYADICKTNLLK